MLTDAVRERMEDQVDSLAGRVQEAADLAALVKAGRWPASPLAAFVLPLGVRALSQGDAAAGVFTQMLDETIGILIVQQAAGDLTGKTALPKIDTLIATLIAKIAGWRPSGVFGVFRVARGQMLSADNGRVIYQLDFTIQNQVRNLS